MRAVWQRVAVAAILFSVGCNHNPSAVRAASCADGPGFAAGCVTAADVCSDKSIACANACQVGGVYDVDLGRCVRAPTDLACAAGRLIKDSSGIACFVSRAGQSEPCARGSMSDGHQCKEVVHNHTSDVARWAYYAFGPTAGPGRADFCEAFRLARHDLDLRVPRDVELHLHIRIPGNELARATVEAATATNADQRAVEQVLVRYVEALRSLARVAALQDHVIAVRCSLPIWPAPIVRSGTADGADD